MKFATVSILWIILLASGCNRSSPEQAETGNVKIVSERDAEMNSIIDDARKTIGKFDAVLQKRKGNQSGFSTKYPFRTDPGSSMQIEYVWLSDISIENGKHYGIVANTANEVKALRVGAKMEFDPTQVGDWKYVEDGYLVGGRSIVYLLKGLSKQERQDVLESLDYRIREFE